MKNHGNFSLTLNKDVVSTCVNEAFNEFGVFEYRKSVLKLVSNVDNWVLYESVDITAGLTPEALDELIATYREFQSNGCTSIAVNTCRAFIYLLESKAFKQIELPTLASTNEDELSTFIQNMTNDK